jgi:RNase adaptor protein for sRNA GlmZ degradation
VERDLIEKFKDFAIKHPRKTFENLLKQWLEERREWQEERERHGHTLDCENPEPQKLRQAFQQARRSKKK